MSQSPQKTLAVIINVRDHGESDKIVTFYSPDKGKMTGIAKGAKRSKKRFVNKLELFTLLEIIFVETRSSLARIDQAELLNPFPMLRDNYPLYVAAVLITELINLWTRENDADEKLFQTLVWALEDLVKDRQPHKTIILFMIRMLTILGFQPHLTNCLSCGTDEPKAAPYFFVTNHSGLFCSTCIKEANSQNIKISLNSMKLLAKAQQLDLNKLNRLKFPANAVKESLHLLRVYSTSILHRDIHSWKSLLEIC